jgi:4'-phosphopantetheinyl transferase
VRVGPALVAWDAPGAGGLDLADTARLSEPDLARADGFDVRRRSEFLRGRALVARLVSRLAPATPGWELASGVCRRCGASHGPVVVAGAPVLASLAYADDGLVVAAAAPVADAGRLGIDVEADAADETRRADLTRLLGGTDEPVLRRWTRIEALLKADGRGLLVDPGGVRLRPGSGRILGESTRYRLADVPGPSGYLISLAWCGGGASAVRPDRAIR